MTSQYGKVFGVPVAVGGALWSALVLMLGVLGMKPGRSETAGRVAGYIFVLSTIGLAGVLYLGYASFFILRQMCPLCLTMYVAVIGLFAVSGAAASGLTAIPGAAWPLICGRPSANPLAATLGVVWVVAASVAGCVLPARSGGGRRRASPGRAAHGVAGRRRGRAVRARGWTHSRAWISASLPTARRSSW